MNVGLRPAHFFLKGFPSLVSYIFSIVPNLNQSRKLYLTIVKIKTDNIFTVQVATTAHVLFAEEICALMEDSAKKRGTGIAKRKPE